MPHPNVVPGAMLALLALCLGAGCQAHPAQSPSYTISVEGNGNAVVPHEDNTEVLFDVTSARGIGSATMTQTTDTPPAKIVIRLHVNGLEEFTFAYGQTVVTLSVASYGDRAVSESVQTAGSSSVPIGPESSYAMPVRAMEAPTSDGESSNSYFEVEAPQDYLQGPNRDFSIRWIDFYR